MDETPLDVTIFILGSTLFVFVSIPTVIAYYIMSVVRRRRDPGWEEKALRKPLSKLERIITISAGVGLMIVSVGMLGWPYYKIFMEGPPADFILRNDSPTLPTIVTMTLWFLALPLIFFAVGFWYFDAGLKKKRPNFRRSK